MGDGNKVEFIVAVCALIASAMAVYIAWDQGRVMRAQQHGSVYPVLQVDGFVSTTPEIARMGMRVSNSGVGPALIEDITLFHDGEEIDGFGPHREGLPAEYDLSWAGLTGRALAPGEEIVPIEILWDRADIAPETLRATAEEWGRFDVTICYCSVFERCWRTRALGTSRADPVKTCPQSETDIFASLARRAPDTDTPTTLEAE